MIPYNRQKVLDTSSVLMFSRARRLLADHEIPCDFSIVYHDAAASGELYCLYVRSMDDTKARHILRGVKPC